MTINPNELLILEAIKAGKVTPANITIETGIQTNAVHLLLGQLLKQRLIEDKNKNKHYSLITEEKPRVLARGNLALPVQILTRNGERFAIRGSVWNPIPKDCKKEDILWLDDTLDSIKEIKKANKKQKIEAAKSEADTFLELPQNKEYSELITKYQLPKGIILDVLDIRGENIVKYQVITEFEFADKIYPYSSKSPELYSTVSEIYKFIETSKFTLKPEQMFQEKMEYAVSLFSDHAEVIYIQKIYSNGLIKWNTQSIKIENNEYKWYDGKPAVKTDSTELLKTLDNSEFLKSINFINS